MYIMYKNSKSLFGATKNCNKEDNYFLFVKRKKTYEKTQLESLQSRNGSLKPIGLVFVRASQRLQTLDR